MIGLLASSSIQKIVLFLWPCVLIILIAINSYLTKEYRNSLLMCVITLWFGYYGLRTKEEFSFDALALIFPSSIPDNNNSVEVNY